MSIIGKNLDRLTENVLSGIVFFAALLMYGITVDRSASFWDCPEYITCASMLEIGHPPGNPFWMLAMRFVTIPFPPEYHALVIGLCSGLFMALAAFFLAKITYALSYYVSTKYLQKQNQPPFYVSMIAATAALTAGMTFAFCDSAWFSAVEAEVYAMSAFLTSLVIWLMIVWAKTYNHAHRKRLLILIAYITGLSLGVHQLNLLCIPVLSLIYVFRKYPYGRISVRAWSAILVSFIIIILILIGMMNGTLSWMQAFELGVVNSLGMPYFSGIYIYLILLASAAVMAVVGATKGSRCIIAISMAAFIWLSGVFVFKGNLIIAAILSIISGISVVYYLHWDRARILSCIFSLAFILLGYSSFAIILIRGYASPPMNEGAPADIFALSSYIARDQYGYTPLFYGATPYSKPMYEETWTPGNNLPEYSLYHLKKEKAKYVPVLSGAKLSYRSRMLSEKDSAKNSATVKSGEGYILSDYSFSRVTTPELDMFFPRITGTSQSDIESYESWVGMSKESMDRIEISEAIDTLGNPVGKLSPSGNREKSFSYRPTYLQNLRFFLSYQVGYMYFRYLLWNFMGRQNDIPSTGEIDHGNFITGFPFIDNAMLGDQNLMPANASSHNNGHNVYYCIPFILGIIGIIFLCCSGKSGRQTLAIITLMFFMTGVAIVIYLNQLPGEPRERDYSFLGSYMAFSIWIGLGVTAISMWMFKYKVNENITCILAIIIAIGTPLIIITENCDDHDRTGRSEPFDYASNLLLTEKPAIIFTQGDNFTFPMWYAQEVMNTGRQHTVVDVSYFATPEYVTNLMKQGERGVPFTATPADIAYGAYSYTRIAPDADTTAIPAIDALRQLYSSREAIPTLHNRRVTLPGKNDNDTLTIDLKNYANGSSMLPFRKLVLLDVLATNAESESPRPVYFHTAVSSDFYRPLKSSTRRLPFVDAYVPGMTDSTHLATLAHNLELPLYVPARDSMPTLRKDPVIADQVRRQRGEIILAARQFFDIGYPRDAESILYLLEFGYPYSDVTAGSFTLADTTFHEGIEFALLKMDLAKRLRVKAQAQQASYAVENMLKESRQWRNYYVSLPKWRRETVSNSSRRLISIIPRLEAIAKECDSLKKILPEPEEDLIRNMHR